MNKEGSVYTFIYATVMVVIVAAALAFLATSLKPKQEANVRIAKMSDVLKTIGIASTSKDAEVKFKKYFGDNLFAVNEEGEVVNKDAKEVFTINLEKELHKQDASQRQLPVYQCKLDDGSIKYILPVRGKGLWDAIWGYVALNDDKNTIFGAVFDHKGETPGLGAQIADAPFQQPFKGKKLFEGTKFVSIEVCKGGAAPGNIHGVDAISGGTLTSKCLQKMLKDCLGSYQKFLIKK